MDVENGFAGSARFGSKDRGSATGRLITAAAALLSLAALAGLLVLALQNRQMQSRMEALHSTDSETLDEAREEEVDTREIETLLQEHLRSRRDTATATSYACPKAPDPPPYYRDCYDSPQTPNSVPSAHIVPDGKKSLCSAADPPLFYANITSGWSCGSKIDIIFLPGYVRGGMVFDRDEGTLKVPVEGVYFVYSQVHVSARNMTGAVVLLGTQTLICEHSHCRETTYMLSRGSTDEGDGPFYHGGLFQLNANSTIKIAAFGKADNSHIGSLAYETYFANTFMGAYLVEEIVTEEDSVPQRL